MKQIVLATRNKHKVEEIKALLSDTGVEMLSLDGFPEVGIVDEDADTLEGNALAKARDVFAKTRLPSLGDDTGLHVGYLLDNPGVRSSRYAGPNATHADNCKKLLAALLGVPERKRGAKFRTVLALVGDGIEDTVEGVVLGRILEGPRGSHGFGYDPLFVPDGSRKTLAEMETSEKNSLSHRARAVENLKPVLEKYFTGM